MRLAAVAAYLPFASMAFFRLGVVYLFVVGATAPATPQPLAERLTVLAGSDAIDCSPEGSHATLADAFSCAKGAIASSKAFRVIVRLQCADCSYWSAAAGSRDGSLWEVIYDTNPRGLVDDTPVLASNPCAALRFDSKGYPFIVCLSKKNGT